MSKPERKPNLGFLFLSEVPDHRLEEWEAFKESTLYLFMKSHFDGRLRRMGETALKDHTMTQSQTYLANFQGRAQGIRDVMEGFFDAIARERKRRINRLAAEQANEAG